MPLFKREKVLYYKGCNRFKLEKQINLYKKILDKLGVKYIEFDEVCCGDEVFELGYETEARKLARRNLNLFKENNIFKIITSSPGCYKFFSQNYKELLPDWIEIEIESIAVTILRELEKKNKLIKNLKSEKVVYHDNSYLKASKIIKEPRELLKLLGYELVEVKGACGGCGIVKYIYPEIAEKISEKLIEKAKKSTGKIITTADCYLGLKEISKDKIEVLELSEAIAYALGLE